MKQRFVAKSQTTGRNTTWGVYDRERACWPVITPEVGKVKQAMSTEEEARVEAERLEKKVTK